MKIYALFNDAGFAVAIFDDLHKPDAIPAEAIEISEAQRAAIVGAPQFHRWTGETLEALPIPEPSPHIPNATLGDWRIGLMLWGRLDTVRNRVEALAASGDVPGQIARERLEYANTVRRSELLQLAPAFGFTSAEVDESLWRAEQVARGDLSGIWPVPA